MICGYAQHGKDTFADYLVACTNGLFSKWSSSVCAMEEALLPYLYDYFPKETADRYDTIYAEQGRQQVLDVMYSERGLHRQGWKDAITNYNDKDPTRLMKNLYEKSNIYVGIRSMREFQAGKDANLFDYSVWVEAPSKPVETTCEIHKTDCQFIIENSGSLESLYTKAELFASIINPDYRRPQSEV